MRIDLRVLQDKNPAFIKFNIKEQDFLGLNNVLLKIKRGIIYIIVNMVNGKVYVGLSKRTFKNRYKKGWWLTTDNDHLARSVEKYGHQSFNTLILEDGRGQNILNILETYYILTFQSHKEEFGYNKTMGGQQYQFSYEVRRKMIDNHPFRLTTQEFIDRAQQIHGNKYDYCDVDYKNSSVHVSIFCKICNKSFQQQPVGHLHGQGCPDCGFKATALACQVTKEEFLQRLSKKFNINEFDINLNNYIALNKGTIMIKHHVCGVESTWNPNLLLISTVGCRFCGQNNKRRFIKERRKREDKEFNRKTKLEKGYQNYLIYSRNGKISKR